MTMLADSFSEPLARWDVHLRGQLANKNRVDTFDMEDVPEQGHLEGFTPLQEAIRFLGTRVGPEYRQADAKAIAYQKTHRKLSKIAILSGGFAIALAILQLALKQSVPSWTGPVAILEGIAAAAGVVAVVVGLRAKFDHQWFLQRHKAERLRMLKFEALGTAEFWSGNQDGWRAWVDRELAGIRAIHDIKEVKDWATSGGAEPYEPTPPTCDEDEASNSAVALYYCRKRVDFQAAHFAKQSKKLKRQSAWLHHFGLPLFFASIVAVMVHFGAEHLAKGAQAAKDVARAHRWELVAIWSLTLAALLPVLSFGVRAWIGAFELARSAHLFDAKHRALLNSSKDLLADRAKCAPTMHHIAHVEHFLAHEHREWLRLLMDAEWFL